MCCPAVVDAIWMLKAGIGDCQSVEIRKREQPVTIFASLTEAESPSSENATRTSLPYGLLTSSMAMSKERQQAEAWRHRAESPADTEQSRLCSHSFTRVIRNGFFVT